MVQTLKVSDTDQAYLKVNWKALGSKKEKNQGVPTLISVHFQLAQVCSAQASHPIKSSKIPLLQHRARTTLCSQILVLH